MFNDNDDVNWNAVRKWGALIALAVFVGLPLCGYASFLGGSWLYQTLTSKVERQNQNADPNFARSVAMDFTNTETDFLRSYNSAPTDYSRLVAFYRANCPSSNWTVQQQAEDQNLITIYTGDFEAMQRDSAHYQQLMQDPDTARWKPDGLPDTLQLPQQEMLPACA